ncbi:hypothetical protein [Actinokineospora enzanensis]|uniref:hypothetical protein n=1 Tax=Actinokineospora enzanensis TaxID=155975 RepID=UPI000686A336|nr:hypothetical protein [Actinokineospora enzanensis]
MDQRGYDGLQSAVFLVGIWEGLVPFASKVFGWEPSLALPLRLPSPLWWIVSAAVVVLSMAMLEILDRAKRRTATPTNTKVNTKARAAESRV